MSFAKEVKSELIRKMGKEKCCQLAELAALIKVIGSLEITNNNLVLKLETKNPAVARRLYKLLQKQFEFKVEIIVRKKMYLEQNNYYIIKLPPQKKTKQLLIDSGLLSENYRLIYQIKEEFIQHDCCSKAYLRGLFLAGGSINEPSSDYHLEIGIEYREYIKELKKLFDKFQIDLKSRKKKELQFIYLKKADDISKFLSIVGAHSSLMKFENARIYKKIRNRVNRIVNCETANLDKTINAAQKQIEDIELIAEIKGLKQLTPSLREMAELRRENPYASLRELGELLEPTLSKSGVNNRLRRIADLADELRDKIKVDGLKRDEKLN